MSTSQPALRSWQEASAVAWTCRACREPHRTLTADGVCKDCFVLGLETLCRGGCGPVMEELRDHFGADRFYEGLVVAAWKVRGCPT